MLDVYYYHFLECFSLPSFLFKLADKYNYFSTGPFLQHSKGGPSLDLCVPVDTYSHLWFCYFPVSKKMKKGFSSALRCELYQDTWWLGKVFCRRRPGPPHSWNTRPCFWKQSFQCLPVWKALVLCPVQWADKASHSLMADLLFYVTFLTILHLLGEFYNCVKSWILGKDSGQDSICLCGYFCAHLLALTAKAQTVLPYAWFVNDNAIWIISWYFLMWRYGQLCSEILPLAAHLTG